MLQVDQLGMQLFEGGLIFLVLACRAPYGQAREILHEGIKRTPQEIECLHPERPECNRPSLPNGSWQEPPRFN